METIELYAGPRDGDVWELDELYPEILFPICITHPHNPADDDFHSHLVYQRGDIVRNGRHLYAYAGVE